MGIVVQKFGGVLLESPEKIRQAAHYIVETKLRGEDPVVVVSAPGNSTDELLRRAAEVSDNPEGRELDMLLSVGERMAMALLALAINAEGKFRAVSFTGSQVGIITDSNHTDASIIEVKGFRIREAIHDNQIPIIAGFQGISIEKEITTLGRGGSDATAVALAAALGAERCELIKAKGGIFSADPLGVEDAQLLPELDYTTLENMTQSGAKVVQPRAAALAKEHNVILSINAPDGTRGTLVVDRTLTKSVVSALTLRSGKFQTGKSSKSPGRTVVRSPELFTWHNDEWCSVAFNNGAEGEPADVVTVVGWGGKLQAEVVEVCLSEAVLALLRPHAILRSEGALNLVVDFGSGKAAINQLHSIILHTGLIERHSVENVRK